LSSSLELEMDYDPDKMLWILSNLLSNAIKYTSEPGDIYIQVDAPVVNGQEQLSIRVQDSGQGIHPDALPYIFDRFYQVEDLASQKRQGSGVGLALVKELVQLLWGTIEATSKLGVGTTFTLHFPISREAPLQDGKIEPVVATGTLPVGNIPLDQANSPAAPESVSNRVSISVAGSEKQSEQPTLLIVEDNADVRLYLSACLGGNYQLLLAENGQEGIDRAMEHVPDLIVSDVMMPVKDGFALCDALKNDARTSHIPIVLLTARADFESRIKGLRRGADAYLAKPFEQEELLLTLQNLLQARQKLQQKFAELYADRTAPAAADPVDTVTDEIEDAFLQQLEGIIMEHISDPDLSPELICREMGMSNTNLYRKLKALTDLSLTFFIRRIRLREAKNLLLNSDMNVTEVAYAVGFSDPKYFSRIFSEVFEQSPSQFRKG
jgi:CheY-like chemotaxis protein/anti-sigma regulatory factor (Ser/Thr protein kinase)